MVMFGEDIVLKKSYFWKNEYDPDVWSVNFMASLGYSLY